MKTTITAHAGSEGTAPNSISSVVSGFESGAEIGEVDVRFMNDGTPVLNHDSLDENADYDLLSEVLMIMNDYPDKQLNIDIKETSHIDNIVSLSKKYGVYDRIFFTGVWKSFVPQTKLQSAGVKYYLNYSTSGLFKYSDIYIDKLIKDTQLSGGVGINFNKKSCSKKLVKKFHSKGLLVSVWTVSNPDEIEKYLKLGVDNITCKCPVKAVKIRDMFYNK